MAGSEVDAARDVVRRLPVKYKVGALDIADCNINGDDGFILSRGVHIAETIHRESNVRKYVPRRERSLR